MGFALFDQSGTWDPAAAGLKVGDQVYVVCVGGGGAGCATYGTNTASGGNGGSSNFGTYLTSLGGYGGGASGSWTGTPTSYMNRGTAGGTRTYNGFTYPGAGAGGWYFEYPSYMNGTYDNKAEVSGTSTYYLNEKVYPPVYCGLGGWNLGIFKHTGSYLGDLEVVTNNSSAVWGQHIGSYTATTTTHQAYISYVPLIPVGAGPSRHLYTGLAKVNVYYGEDSQFCNNTTPAAGGLGYGAGGASVRQTTNLGACSGEIKRQMITLTSAAPISIGVGGGGSPGYSWNTSDFGLGVNGTTGAGAVPSTSYANNQYIQHGGYGTGFPIETTGYSASSPQLYAGGAGASGCVAIWW